MGNTNLSIQFSSFVVKRCDFTYCVIDSSSRAHRNWASSVCGYWTFKWNGRKITFILMTSLGIPNDLWFEKDNYLSIPLFNNYIIHLCKWYDKSHRIWDVFRMFCILSSHFSVSTLLFLMIIIYQEELELKAGLTFSHVTMEQMESIRF